MTIIKSILFSVLVLFALSSISSAQLVVLKKPIRLKVVVVKTVKPGKNFVWIEGQWKVNGNKHIWVNGRWSKNRPDHHWVKGHWKRKRAGWNWVAGRWSLVTGH